MAPELALNSLKNLKIGSLVLDPMAGSGTVLRQAIALGHRAIGFDMDPLAILMSRVWTTPVDDSSIRDELKHVLDEARAVDLRYATLSWVTGHPETRSFIEFWFGPTQRRELKRLSFILDERTRAHLGPGRRAAVDVLRLALSRIIVTKEQSASLARDTSHSRPHKVADSSDYNVFEGFERSVNQLRTRLKAFPATVGATVDYGDARDLDLRTGSVDAVMTSPPYLNAIDYLRGHRMSLVWLGHSIEDLRKIRSASIGAERSSDNKKGGSAIAQVAAAMCDSQSLQPRLRPIIERYAKDLIGMTMQIARVLKRGGGATFVVGNSCLKGTFIKNSAGVAQAAALAGMTAISETERELPSGNRYLPITGTALSKRMRTETVLKYSK
jgi:hypothetical protein